MRGWAILVCALWGAGCALTVVEPTASGGRRLRVPDAYPTISAALANAKRGDEVLVGPGRYEESFTIPSGVAVKGSGALNTVVYHTDADIIDLSNKQDVRLEALTLEGSSSATNEQSLLWVRGGSTLVIRDCRFSGGSKTHAAVEIAGVNTNVNIEGGQFSNNKSSGLYIHSGAIVHVEKSLFSSNGLYGMSVRGSGTRVRAVDVMSTGEVLGTENVDAQNKNTGLYIRGGAIVYAEKLLFSHYGLHGISVKGAGTQVHLVDVASTNNAQLGIYIYQGGAATIGRSLFSHNGLDGIAVRNPGSTVDVNHSVSWSNRQSGIWGWGEARIKLRNSIIAENGFWGLSLTDDEEGYALAANNNNLYWNNGSGPYKEELGRDYKNDIVGRDPRFENPLNGDFRLHPDSPAIGKAERGDNMGLFPLARPPSYFAWTLPVDHTKGGGASALLQSPQFPHRGRKLAIVIGVQDYRDRTIRDLRYTQNDATEVAALLDSIGYDVRLWTDADRPATYLEIKKALLQIANAGPEDHLVFYFSGHGSDATNTLGEGRGFLLPRDADDDNIELTAIPFEDVRKAVDRSEAGRVVVLLDACFAAGGKSVSRNDEVKQIDANTITGVETFGSGKFALYSSRDNEASHESPEHRNGYFTHFLLEAWEIGHRDIDAVYAYVFNKVKEETGQAQHPRRDYRETEGSFSLF